MYSPGTGSPQATERIVRAFDQIPFNRSRKTFRAFVCLPPPFGSECEDIDYGITEITGFPVLRDKDDCNFGSAYSVIKVVFGMSNGYSHYFLPRQVSTQVFDFALRQRASINLAPLTLNLGPCSYTFLIHGTF